MNELIYWKIWMKMYFMNENDFAVCLAVFALNFNLHHTIEMHEKQTNVSINIIYQSFKVQLNWVKSN